MQGSEGAAPGGVSEVEPPVCRGLRAQPPGGLVK